MSTTDFEGEATRRRRLTQEAVVEHLRDLESKADLHHRRGSLCDKPCLLHLHSELHETHSESHQPGFFTPKMYPVISSTPTQCLHHSEDVHACDECLTKTTLVAENEVEAHRVSNNYKFGFKKWKSHVTERPWEDRSQIVKELCSELNMVKTPLGSLVTCGNVFYVFLFGWWLSLFYFLLTALMFFTVLGAPYGKMCWSLSGYFLWPFGKVIRKTGSVPKKYFARFGKCEAIPEVDEVKETTYLLNNAARIPDVLQTCTEEPNSQYWRRFSTYLWLLLAYPVLTVVHTVACVLSWSMMFSIPVAKINARMIRTVLLMSPEQVVVQQPRRTDVPSDDEVVLCCYYAFNIYYYKYTVDGINIFAVNLIPLVLFTILMGYLDSENHFTNSITKFTLSLVSIMPLSYYIGMAIASISAQSNFAVGAVVNATFGSIIELTFYITALIKGVKEGKKCYEEVVKSALTGTLLGCVLFVPGVCALLGGLKHEKWRFQSRAFGVTKEMIFLSNDGVFAPTLFSKAYGNLICQGCRNISEYGAGPFECLECHSGIMENNGTLFVSHIQPLIYTVSILLPCAYLIGLLFCLKTHSHIYDIHISGCHGKLICFKNLIY
ncbi:putative cation exchanger C521.04c [Protopterus annectens]|uniref:putative cation exchanger C521.04c n=1 Tax=Protopterus annectens TaxID=7888 RepID=UPI001CFA3F6F|nr:putative cation exchanger C521.04c [Protopterus annectens]